MLSGRPGPLHQMRLNPECLDFATEPKKRPLPRILLVVAFHHSTTSSPKSAATFYCYHRYHILVIPLRMPREPSAKYDSHGHENGHYYTANAAPYSQPDVAGLSYMEPQQIIPVIQEPVPKKKHICSTCDRIFTTSGHLARHARVHTGEKNHQCPFPNCKTRCSRQDNLQQQ